MKNIFLGILLGVAFTGMIGCNSDVIQPSGQGIGGITTSGQSVQIIELPSDTRAVMAKNDKAKGLFRAVGGGTLAIQEQFLAKNKIDTVHISTTFTLPANAINVDQEIEMVFDDSKTAIVFGPHGLQFNEPGMLSYKISGLDLSSLPLNVSINLYYIDQESRHYEQMPSDVISVDRLTGTIESRNGIIPHFSMYAYGYVKK